MIERLTRRKHLAEAYKHIFATEQGKDVLTDLCRSVGITIKNRVTMDKDELLFREGQQSVVYGILKQIGTDTEELMSEIEKQYNRQKLT